MVAVINRLTISIWFYRVQNNDGAKGIGWQGTKAIEAFEYKNTESDFRCCDNQEKWKTCQTTELTIPGTQEVFSDNVSPDIDDFTDEPEFQRDVKNTF